MDIIEVDMRAGPYEAVQREGVGARYAQVFLDISKADKELVKQWRREAHAHLDELLDEAIKPHS